MQVQSVVPNVFATSIADSDLDKDQQCEPSVGATSAADNDCKDPRVYDMTDFEDRTAAARVAERWRRQRLKGLGFAGKARGGGCMDSGLRG